MKNNFINYNVKKLRIK